MICMYSLYVKLKAWLDTLCHTDAELCQRSVAEQQAKQLSFTIQGQIDLLLPLYGSLGYVLLFSGVCPFIVPLCFLVFAVQLRANAYMVTNTAKRVFPQGSKGVGFLKTIVGYLNKAGILYSGFLLVGYGATFQGMPLVGRMSGFIVYCLMMALVWEFVNIACSPQDPQTRILSD